MPKWEYCMLTGMSEHRPHTPDVTGFVRITSKGFEHVGNIFKRWLGPPWCSP